jgi:hypothetical protein
MGSARAGSSPAGCEKILFLFVPRVKVGFFEKIPFSVRTWLRHMRLRTQLQPPLSHYWKLAITIGACQK